MTQKVIPATVLYFDHAVARKLRKIAVIEGEASRTYAETLLESSDHTHANAYYELSNKLDTLIAAIDAINVYLPYRKP